MIGNTTEIAASKVIPPEMLGGCCVCSDEEGWADNSLVYCDGDGCSVAVHQACYGILRVPEGNWYCRRCEAIRAEKATASEIRCELCHRRDGALKATDAGKWCHVLCALYIPEATFGDVQAMEPIILRNVQRDRFGRSCSLCNGTQGACTQCNCSAATNTTNQGRGTTSCSVSFHVSCAQRRGMLCELQIGGTTRYPAFCEEHLKTLKTGLKLKRLPPYKGPPAASTSSHSAPVPALRPRRKEATNAEKSNGGSSPAAHVGDTSDQQAARATRSGSASSPAIPEGPQPSSTSASHVQSEGVRHSSSTDSAEKERKKAKLLKKRHAEMMNGQPSSDKSASVSSKSLSNIEKKSRGRQKGSTKKQSTSLSSPTDAKDSPVPPAGTGNNGLVFYGQLSQEAAIRVRHASGKDSAKKEQTAEPTGSQQQSQQQPQPQQQSTTEDTGEAKPSTSSNVDLWSAFSQKKASPQSSDKDNTAAASSVLPKPEPNSLEELLDETFWRETGRFLLSEIQQSAPADIVELLHALYQVELENQQLEAKIATMSSAIDAQRLTAARLAVPLNANMAHFQTPAGQQFTSSASAGHVNAQSGGAPNLPPAPQQQPMQPQSQHQQQHPSAPTIPSVIPFMFPHVANGVAPMSQPHGGQPNAGPYQMKGGPQNQGAPSMNAPGPKQLPPAIPSPYVMPTDMAAMQQMQFQLYQHLYQQQIQHHLQPPTSTGQPMPQQPKLEAGTGFGAQLPMSPPMMPAQAPQPPPQPSAAVLSTLSAMSTQQQQRSLPMKLVEPAPNAAASGNLLSVGSSAPAIPPEGVLVPPPPPLLSAPVIAPPNSMSSTSPAVSNKKVADQTASTSSTATTNKAQTETTNG